MKRVNQQDVNTPELYDEIYFGERAIEFNAGITVGKFLKMFARGKVLDVGCGLGKYFPFMEHCQITGVDFAPKTVEQTRKDYPNTQIDVWDIAKEGLRLYDTFSFDTVFCGETIEHREDPQGLVNGIFRVLKPGATAILTTPFEDRIPCAEHIWTYDDEDLYKMFEVAGFENTCVFRYYNVRAADWEHFLVVARKPL